MTMKKIFTNIALMVTILTASVNAQSFDLMSATQSDKIASSPQYIVTSDGIELYETTNTAKPFAVSSSDTLFVATTSTMTSVNDRGVMPTTTALSQNYPNPFNAATVIRYSVDQPSDVVVKVYDITGKEVATLVNEKKSTGTFSIGFTNSNVASGTYIYQLIAHSESGNTTRETKKMVVLK